MNTNDCLKESARLAYNVLQISEGGLMRLACFARFCLCAVSGSLLFRN